jgi:hypothetical protein
MEKVLGIVLCLLVMGTAAFAQDKVIGAGGMYNFANTFGTLDWKGFNGENKPASNWAMTRNGFGGFVFFGARFFELNLGALLKNPDVFNIEGEKWTTEESQLFETFAFQFGIYLKYPFNLSGKFVLFPTIGADFEYTVDSNAEWWHDIWARAGLGLDFFFAERFFLRGQAIYGAAFPIAGANYLGVKISHGLLAKLGLGWLF